MWIFWRWDVENRCREKRNIAQWIKWIGWIQCIHMTIVNPLLPLSLSSYITDFCAIFLSTYMSSARHAMKATNKVAVTACTAQVFFHLNMVLSTQLSLWTERIELVSICHAHRTCFCRRSNERQLKVGRRREDSKWDKKNQTNEEEIGKHESIFNAEILMCLCSFLYVCLGVGVCFNANKKAK